MATAKAAKEPSMEEILASIRQIIADEDAPVAEKEETNDQAAIDDAFDSIDVGDDEEMSTSDVDALFDSPDASEDVNDQAAIDAAFDSLGADDEEMSTDDVDALFDTPDMDASEDEDALVFDAIDDDDDDEEVLDLSADQTIAPAMEMPKKEITPPPPPPPVAAAVMPPVQQPVGVAPSNGILNEGAASAVKASFGVLEAKMGVGAGHSVEGLVCDMLRPMLKEWLDENLPSLVEKLVEDEIKRVRGD